MYHNKLYRSKAVNELLCKNPDSIENFFTDDLLASSETTSGHHDDEILEKKPAQSEQMCDAENVNLWPNCDTTVWMRSCEKEVIDPICGRVTGTIPTWLSGTLLRNGPGNLKVGEYTYNHLFDSSALLHRFEISKGTVTYQNRFVQTDVYKKSQAAKRIIVSEFGTKAVPDPCQTIFERIAATFRPNQNMSDNSMISIYPFGDEYYTFTEVPIMHRINPKTLETLGKVNMTDRVGIVNHSSHPHVMSDNTVYNLGLSITTRGPAYNIVCFSPNRITVDDSGKEVILSMFDQARIVATAPSRWLLNPSYMHTFGITENYFIIIEQPLAISLTTVVSSGLRNDPMNASLKWHDNENTLIHVISRENGKVVQTFVSETFFFLHIINQFETQDGNYVVLDVCCYRDAKMLDCMYIEMMKNAHKNPDYPSMFRARALRFVMPMTQIAEDVSPEYNLITITSVHQNVEIEQNNDTIKSNQRINSERQRSSKVMDAGESATDMNSNYNVFLGRKATAHRLSDGNIFLKPELLCDLGCETPRINYESFLGREYRYFYAISCDLESDTSGMIIKVDNVTKTRRTWSEKGVFPSEAIFVPNPDKKAEDDGVVLSALVWGKGREREVGLLVLDATTFTEIARATFVTPSSVPKCLHGWFTFEK